MKKFPTGYGIVQTAVMQNKKISVPARALYGYLAAMTGSKDFCWPSQFKMADDFNVTERTIQRHLAELEKNQVLLTTKLYNDGRQNNKY